jgi:hypothetical protein
MIEIALSAQLIVYVAVLFVFLASGQGSVFHPAVPYLAFHGLAFVARPILVHFFGFDAIWRYMVFEPTEGEFIRTLVLTSLSLVVFVGTSLRVGRAQIGFAAGAAPEVSRKEREALLWLTILLLPILAWSIYSTREGIPGERAANGIFIMTKTSGYITDAQCMLGPLLGAWLVVTRFHWLNSLPILLYIAYRSWFGWARWTILLFFLMVVVTYCWYQKKKWVPLWALLLAVPVLLLFNTLGHNRDILRNYLSGEEARPVEERPGMSPAEKMALRWDTQDFANFEYLTAIMAIVPKLEGPRSYGLQYLQLFTEPIPRFFWKNKPPGMPWVSINLAAHINFVGLTWSLPGDGWVSGGWIGAVITLGIAGAVAGLAHRWFWGKKNSPTAALFYLSFLAVSPNWYRDGGISIFKFVLWSWLPLILWRGLSWFLGDRKVPAYSIVLPRGDGVRLIARGENGSVKARLASLEAPTL